MHLGIVLSRENIFVFAYSVVEVTQLDVGEAQRDEIFEKDDSHGRLLEQTVYQLSPPLIKRSYRSSDFHLHKCQHHLLKLFSILCLLN